MQVHEFELLAGLLLAVLLGIVGQGFRAVAGVKKLADEAEKNGKSFGEMFDVTAFGISLFIGSLAGVACYIGLRFGNTSAPVDFTQGATVLGVIAAGYAGTDFIEAFAKKYLPK